MGVRAGLVGLLLLAGLLPAQALGSSSAAALAEPTTQRLIVKFRPLPGARAAAESERGEARVSRLAGFGGIALAYVRPMALGAHVVALDHAVPLSGARAIANRLAAHAEVEYIQPDSRMHAQFVAI